MLEMELLFHSETQDRLDSAHSMVNHRARTKDSLQRPYRPTSCLIGPPSPIKMLKNLVT